MNISRFRNVCNSSKLFFKFRGAHTATKSDAGVEVLTKQDPKISQTPLGITVASVENYSPVSQMSVVVKAGSRYEDHQNLGISHCLRNSASLATKKHTAFTITRDLELKGSRIDVLATREHVIYTVQCVRDEIDHSLEILADISTNQAFKPWEVNDSSYRIKLDLAFLENNPEAILMEALHKAAFRGGLANSLFCPTFMVGNHKTESLLKYVKDNFTAPRTCIVGLGVNHENLQNEVSKLFDLTLHSGPEGTSKFGGGEVRIEKDIPFVYTAIAAEGSGLTNTKEALSLGVLQCLLGSAANSKLGNSSLSKLGSAVPKSVNNPFTVSSLNINYSDTGLFGIYLVGAPGDMKEIVKSIVSQMREVTRSFNENDIENAKHQLKAKIRFGRENSKDLLSAMCIDASCFGLIRDVADIDKSISELKASDISAVASRVMKTKPAMASVGRLHSTPYIDELI